MMMTIKEVKQIEERVIRDITKIIERRKSYARKSVGIAYCGGIEDDYGNDEAEYWKSRYLELNQLLDELENIKSKETKENEK